MPVISTLAHRFPHELFLEIFKYFDLSDPEDKQALLRFRLVCHIYQEFVTPLAFAHTICISSKQASPRPFRAHEIMLSEPTYISIQNSITHLSIQGRFEIKLKGRAYHLAKRNLYMCCLLKMTRHLLRLVSLNLCHIEWRNYSHAQKFSRELAHPPYLQIRQLHHLTLECMDFGSEVTPYFMTLLAYYPASEVNLYGISAFETTLHDVAAFTPLHIKTLRIRLSDFEVVQAMQSVLEVEHLKLESLDWSMSKVVETILNHNKESLKLVWLGFVGEILEIGA